ncbi:MAG: helix-turn-helix transcriptional regulator, partial [Gammaproteobacteria bacterium]
LDELAREFGAVGADLHLLRHDQPLAAYMGAQPPEVLNEYPERFLHREPRSQALHGLRAGRVVTDCDITDAETLRSHEYYADFLPRNGMGGCIAAVPCNDGTLRAYLGVHYPRGVAEPSHQARRAIEALQPRLARAVKAQLRIVSAELDQGLHAQVLDRLATGVLVLDETGQILFANAAARALCGPRRALHCVGGRLVSGDDRQAARLQALQKAALTRQGTQGGSVLLRGATGETLAVTVDPCPAARAHAGGAAFVFVTSPRGQGRAWQRQQLEALFRFTPAEAKVAMHLARGLTLPQIATECGTTYESVRFTLKRVYDKAGVHKQGELVALLNAAVPPLRERDAETSAATSAMPPGQSRLNS